MISPGQFHMKRSRFTESQIVQMLKEAEAGISLPDLCRTYGFSQSSFYKWKAKYGGTEAPHELIDNPCAQINNVVTVRFGGQYGVQEAFPPVGSRYPREN